MPTLQEQVAKAENALQNGAIQQAVELCNLGLRYFPKHITFHYLLGEAQRARNQIEDAERNFRRVLSANPEYVPARRAVATIHESRRDLAAAYWQIERAFELAPDDQNLRADMLRVGNALALSGIGNGFYTSSRGRLKLTRGALARLYMRLGLYEQALKEFQQVLRREPQRLDVLTGLVETLWKAGHYEEAVKISRQILEDSPDCIQALLIIYHAMSQDLLLPPLDDHAPEPPSREELLKHMRELDPNDTVAQGMFPDRPLPKQEIPDLSARPEAHPAQTQSGTLVTPEAGSYTDWFAPEVSATGADDSVAPSSTVTAGEPGTAGVPAAMDEAEVAPFSFLADDLNVGGGASQQVASAEELAAFEAELTAMESERSMSPIPPTQESPAGFEDGRNLSVPNIGPAWLEPNQATARNLPPFLADLAMPGSQHSVTGNTELPPFLAQSPAGATEQLRQQPPAKPVDLPPFLTEPEQSLQPQPGSQLPRFILEPQAATPVEAELPPFLAEPELPIADQPRVADAVEATAGAPNTADTNEATALTAATRIDSGEPVLGGQTVAAAEPSRAGESVDDAVAASAMVASSSISAKMPSFLLDPAAEAAPAVANLPSFLAEPAPAAAELPPFLLAAEPPAQAAPALQLPPDLLEPAVERMPAEPVYPEMEEQDDELPLALPDLLVSPAEASAQAAAPVEQAGVGDEWADLLGEDFSSELDPEASARLDALLSDPSVVNSSEGLPAIPGLDFAAQSSPQTIAEAMRTLEQQGNATSQTSSPAVVPLKMERPAEATATTTGRGAHAGQAATYLQAGQFDEAAEEYDKALRDEPDQVMAIIDGLEEIIRARADHPGAHKVLGDAYMRAGRFQEAMREFDWLSKNQR